MKILDLHTTAGFKDSLLKILSRHARLREIVPETKLCVMDSLSVVETVNEVEDFFGVSISFEETRGCKTYEELEKLIIEKKYE